MWWLLTGIAGATLWFLTMLFGVVPPPDAKILIKIRHGQLRVTRGQVRAQSREFVVDILRQANVTNGFIAITYYKRAAFSRNIPRDTQQRLRNVLLNN
jgi:hypothetical protein